MTDFINNPAITRNTRPPGILVSDHYNKTTGYAVNRTDGVMNWHITFTLSGTGMYKVNNNTWYCQTGDIVIIPPNIPHYYATSSEEPWNFTWAHFIPKTDWLDLLKSLDNFDNAFLLSIKNLPIQNKVLQAFKQLLQNNIQQDFFHNRIAYNSLEYILLLIAQHNAKNQAPKIDYRVEKLLDYLQVNLKKKHTLESLAKNVSLSPSRLSHLFKQEVGDSIVQYLLKMRLRQAANLLEYTSDPILEIAEEVGFQNPYYFTRQFSTYYGVSPKYYRKRHK
ncbi:helix-turn-helix domain-containing protein [Gracilibacillus sp. D59]|uniref:helix-turn-helix domain-containing protein n=1 Tax=Gracilibacillus sp. D59 TaxID=3457434 RepID=UPI003FCDB1FB